jgi:diketogulonate reductase-like aldo/keto reductase
MQPLWNREATREQDFALHPRRQSQSPLRVSLGTPTRMACRISSLVSKVPHMSMRDSDTRNRNRLARREFLERAGSLAAVGTIGALTASVPSLVAAQTTINAPLTRMIPRTNESMPAIGLGSWITFNVGNDPRGRDASAEVVRAFFDAGGRMIDSSPMYGSSQPTIGYALKKLNYPNALFSAEKVWIGGVAEGAKQMEASRSHWGVPRFDLMQVHNLLSWREHLPKLQAMKAAGQLRYLGITTSHGRRHDDIEKIMRSEAIDFVQISYSLVDREIEQRILPVAQERGIGIIVNRPFREGALLESLRKHRVPAWAAEIDCTSWAQVALKFVITHPGVTCAIPATSQLAHVRENMAAMRGRMPDAALRARMASDVARLV